jgi:glyoxylase-like metal-dependent hydrolase (beta-lactamase superfamily II)
MPTLRTFPILVITTLLAACGKDPEPQAVQPAEPAATPAVASANVHEFKIGELAAFALKDGAFVFPNDAKTVGVGRSPEEIAKLLEAAGVSTTEVSLSIQPLLVKSNDKVLLFDTGAGAGAGEVAGKLVASMSEAGIDPASVTDIFVSHAHGDHIGGVVDGSGALVFPNATVRMSAPEWDSLQSSAAADANRAALVQALTPKVETFAPGAEIVPNVVKAVEIKGHTPGHSGYLITSGAESLLYIGDTAHHYIVSVQQPDWTIQFDRDAPTAQASRKEVIAANARAAQRIYAVHFPFPGVGKFSQQGEGFVWTPEQ